MASELGKLRALFQQHLNLTEDDLWAVDYMICMVFVNIWHQDPEPVWGYLVAPPASCKTELLRTLDGWPYAIVRDEFTENAFASGSNEEGQPDPSLLPQLDGKVLVIKDFTTVLGSNPTTLVKTLSVLRAAYDGSFTKVSGKVGTREYKCKFGIVAAVTPVIDSFLAANQKLGERFVVLRIHRIATRTRQERTASIRHVRSKMAGKTQWRTLLRVATHQVLTALKRDTFRLDPATIAVPQATGDILDNMADLVCRLRTAAIEGHPTEAEAGSRFVQQLTNMAKARCVCDGRATLSSLDLYFARRLAQDSITRMSRHCLTYLYNQTMKKKYLSSDQISAWTGVEKKDIHTLLAQWSHLNLVEKNPNNYTWKLSDDALEQIHLTNLLDPKPVSTTPDTDQPRKELDHVESSPTQSN